MARVGIFRDKDAEYRVQGILSKRGYQAFEWARQQLQALYRSVMGVAPTVVSDADTIEFMARGEQDTTRYLEQLKRDR